MERIEANILKIKNQINTQKIKMQSLKIKMQNEDNDILYDKYENEYNETFKFLNRLNLDLEKEIDAEKKEKFAYKKSLTKLKESLNLFYKDTKNNTKIKRHIDEINGIISYIDRYLG